jgi:antitoxin MazE
MHVQFARWGNSLALRIPKAMAESISATAGSPATIAVENGALVVRPAVPSYRIEDLVEGMQPQQELMTGAPVGKEII